MSVPALNFDNRALPPLGPRELAERYALPLVDLRTETVHADAAESIPMHVLKRIPALPYRIEGGTRLEGRRRRPRQDPAHRRAPACQPLPGRPRRCSRRGHRLRAAPAGHGQDRRRAQPSWATARPTRRRTTTSSISRPRTASRTPEPIQLVNSVILQAADESASDVHFLPQGDAILARIRVDGILHEWSASRERTPLGCQPDQGAREARHRRAPHAAGRTAFASRQGVRASFDLRVAVLPTVEGEGVDHAFAREDPSARHAHRDRALERDADAARGGSSGRSGAFLVTGPTGSGKSTTCTQLSATLFAPRST